MEGNRTCGVNPFRGWLVRACQAHCAADGGNGKNRALLRARQVYIKRRGICALVNGKACAAQVVERIALTIAWCARWNEEIGGIYNKTDEGKRAPLRRVDISENLPADIEFSSRANFTPTFVLIEDGKEVGRIEGYPGEHFFWPMLGQLLNKLPDVADGGS